MQKKIIIVGASSGLGRLVAEEFIEKGWKVGAAARNENALRQLKANLGDNLEWERIDITDDDAPQRLEALIERTGGMDIYFHASGICIENPETEAGADISTVKTNVEGFARMIDSAFAYFRDTRTPGQIAAITSVAGTKGIADLASYSASKRFQWVYLQALEQLARREKIAISFTDIRPGWTLTPLVDPDRRYMMAMQPERVARSITKAIIKKKRVAVINRRWAFMTALWRLVPSWVWTRIPLHASRPAK